MSPSLSLTLSLFLRPSLRVSIPSRDRGLTTKCCKMLLAPISRQLLGTLLLESKTERKSQGVSSLLLPNKFLLGRQYFDPAKLFFVGRQFFVPTKLVFLFLPNYCSFWPPISLGPPQNNHHFNPALNHLLLPIIEPYPLT